MHEITCEHCGLHLMTKARRFCSRACNLKFHRACRTTPLPQCRIVGNRVEVDGDTAVFFIDTDPVVRIIADATDVELLSAWTWRVNKYMRVQGRTSGSRQRQYMARLLLQPGQGMQVDHINGDPLDNRRCNLRVCTPAQNSQNHVRGYGDKSLPRGVGLVTRTNKAGRVRHYFRVEHKLNGENIGGGYFKTVEEADAAAKAWRAKHMPFSAEGDGRVAVPHG